MPVNLNVLGMPEERYSALLKNPKEDLAPQEKLKIATDLDPAIAIAKRTGLDATKADWLHYLKRQTLELSDKKLECASGGKGSAWREGTSTGYGAGISGPDYSEPEN